MNCGRPYREAIWFITPSRREAKGRSLGASTVRLRSSCLVVTFVLLLLSGPSADRAAACSNERGAAVVQTTLMGAIETYLSSLGVERKYWPTNDQLEVLTSPAEAYSDLSVQDLYWDSLRATLYFRMTCGSRKACAPFLVRAHIPAASADVLRQQFPPNRQLGYSATLNNTHRANRCQQPSLLVHAGRPATLLLRRENLKLTTPVIALECGVAGQQVRTRAKRTNKLLEAEVVGENLLVAAF
jgi:hypothetical protein